MGLKIKKSYIAVIGIVIAVLIIFFTVKNLTGSSVSEVEINSENLRIAEISLPGMFCGGCAWSSENAFKGMNGVVDANVSIDTKSGIVIYDSSIISKEELVQDGLIQSYDGEIVSDNVHNG